MLSKATTAPIWVALKQSCGALQLILLSCWRGGGAVGADEGNLAVGGAGKFTTALLVSDTRITHTHLILLLTFLETILFIKQVQ